MDNNEKYFHQKFIECGKILSVQSSDLVSLKYRNMRNHQYYNDLLDNLGKVKGITIKDLGNILNGRAYLISANKQKIILVEHETGLEILYIAGSIASLIGIVLQISSMVSSHRRNINSFSEYYDVVELRYINSEGKFIEEHKHNYLPIEMFLPTQVDNNEIELLKKKIVSLEKKVNRLSKNQTKKKKK